MKTSLSEKPGLGLNEGGTSADRSSQTGAAPQLGRPELAHSRAEEAWCLVAQSRLHSLNPVSHPFRTMAVGVLV